MTCVIFTTAQIVEMACFNKMSENIVLAVILQADNLLCLLNNRDFRRFVYQVETLIIFFFSFEKIEPFARKYVYYDNNNWRVFSSLYNKPLGYDSVMITSIAFFKTKVENSCTKHPEFENESETKCEWKLIYSKNMTSDRCHSNKRKRIASVRMYSETSWESIELISLRKKHLVTVSLFFYSTQNRH